MSPRGVAIPDVRQRLFAAAERVLAREGAGALTSRSIASEAGCAKGLLHNHFADLDEFVADLVLDRLAEAADQISQLPAHVSTRTVAENLAEAAQALLDSNAPAVAGAAMTRAGASARVRQAFRDGAPGFAAIEASLTDYLEAEKTHRRVAANIDSAAVALAIVGTAHHLIMTGEAAPADQQDRLRRVVDMLEVAARP
jgi:AcrR family transcriptional regulator